MNSALKAALYTQRVTCPLPRLSMEKGSARSGPEHNPVALINH